MQDFTHNIQSLTIAKDASTSGTVKIPRWVVYVGLYVPDIDAANVTIDVSIDGTNYVPLLDPADGEDYIACASGSDPGIVDVSDYLKFLPWHKTKVLLRVKTSAAQTTAAVTFYIIFKG